MVAKFKDISGQVFGRLTALEVDIAKTATSVRTYWKCKCQCGSTTVVTTSKLLNNHTRSCGCWQRELASNLNATHRLSKESLYVRYCGIKSRCYNSENSKYSYYGGRGISMCEQWKEDYIAFREWAYSNGYDDRLELDRIDNNGNYEPGNCRWVTKTFNSRNKRSNVMVDSVMLSDLVREISQELNLTESAIYSRYYRLKKANKEITKQTLSGNIG